MKIFPRSFIAVLFAFLIINSYVLAASCKITLARTRVSKVHNSASIHSRNKGHLKMHSHRGIREFFRLPSKNEVICTDASQRIDPDIFDFIEFMVAIINRVSSSFTGDVADTLGSKFKPANLLDEKCKNMLEENFKAEIAKIKEEVYQRARARVTSHTQLMNDLGLSEPEKQVLQEHHNNPLKLCTVSVGILENKLADAEKWNRRAEKLTKLIDFSIENKHTLKDLEERSHDIYKTEKKKVLYDWILNEIDPKRPPKDLRPLLIQAKIELQDSYHQSKMNESEIKALQQFKCENLPPYLKDSEKDTCIRVSFATKALAAIKLLTLKNLKICLASLGINQVVGILAGFAVDKILSILLNMVGLFAYSMVKIVYYAVKVIYYLYEAHSKKNDLAEKSRNYGDAVGTAIKIVLAILQVTKKRR